jgi:hypothetical protein
VPYCCAVRVREDNTLLVYVGDSNKCVTMEVDPALGLFFRELSTFLELEETKGDKHEHLS